MRRSTWDPRGFRSRALAIALFPAPRTVSSAARFTLGLTWAHKTVLVLVGIGILTAGAWLSVPFYPVPLTLQTLAVLLIGGLMGPALGVSAVAGYLALGAMGAPLFHNGLGGLAVLSGPTGGYLVGFLLAVLIMGLASRWAMRGRAAGEAGDGAGCRGRQGWGALLVLAVGAAVATVAIYAVGVPWLAVFTGSDLSGALAVGAAPFVLGDTLKAAVAIGAIRLGGDLLARRGLLMH